MNKALIVWLSEPNRSLGTSVKNEQWYVTAYVGGEVYKEGTSFTREAAEDALVDALTSEFGKVLSAKDD